MQEIGKLKEIQQGNIHIVNVTGGTIHTLQLGSDAPLWPGPYEVTPGAEPIVLETAGYRMDQDLTVGIGSQVAVNSLSVTDNGTYTAPSGTAYSPVTVNVPSGLQYVKSLYSATVALKDTEFNGWTPSTTAKAILASTDVGTFEATSVDVHDYLSRFLIEINIVYTNNTTAKGRYVRTVADNWYSITKRPNSYANMNSATRNAVAVENLANTMIQLYYTSPTALTLNFGLTYGIYVVNSAPVSSADVDSPTITVKRPTIEAKCHATYFSTAQAALVDKTNSTIKFKHEVYRSLTPYNRQKIYLDLINVWNNGL